MNEIYTRKHIIGNKILSYDCVNTGVIVKEYEGAASTPIKPTIGKIAGSDVDFYVKGVKPTGADTVTVNGNTIKLNGFTFDKESDHIEFTKSRYAQLMDVRKNKDVKTMFIAFEINETTVVEGYRIVWALLDENGLYDQCFYIFIGGDFDFFKAFDTKSVVFYVNGVNTVSEKQSEQVGKKIIMCVTINDNTIAQTPQTEIVDFYFNDIGGDIGENNRLNYNLYRVTTFNKQLSSSEVATVTEQIKKELEW